MKKKVYFKCKMKNNNFYEKQYRQNVSRQLNNKKFCRISDLRPNLRSQQTRIPPQNSVMQMPNNNIRNEVLTTMNQRYLQKQQMEIERQQQQQRQQQQRLRIQQQQQAERQAKLNIQNQPDYKRMAARMQNPYKKETKNSKYHKELQDFVNQGFNPYDILNLPDEFTFDQVKKIIVN